MKKAVIAAVLAAVTIGMAAGGYATFSASTTDSLPTGKIEKTKLTDAETVNIVADIA